MTQLTLYVILAFSLVLILLALGVLLLKQWILNLNQTFSTLSLQNKSLMDLVNKQNNLILSKDPMTFQQLEMMNQNTTLNSENGSMSDYAEYQRWVEANGFTEELGEPVYDPDGDTAQQQLFGTRD